MSDKILRALMQLFAIIAKVDNPNAPKNIIELLNNELPEEKLDFEIVANFLKSELNSLNVKKYLDLFNEYVDKQNRVKAKKDGNVKRASLNSVKVLRICSDINLELTQRQKIIVLIRLIEFIDSTNRTDQRDVDFISTVSEMFKISLQEFNLLLSYLSNSDKSALDNSNILFIDSNKSNFKQSPHIEIEGIDKEIKFLRLKSINTIFFKYLGVDELYMNGQIVANRTHVFNQGSRIKTSKSSPIYYSDVISNFLHDKQFEKFNLSVKNLTYKHRNSDIGLQAMTFSHKSGELVGIMGSSGSGKTTLLDVLNGSRKPEEGSVEINGINIHKEKKNLEGIIGYISQDDLLIEELTVYQNLFYNAKLCFNEMSNEFIHKRVLQTLINIGLIDEKERKVGGILSQGISGGQRKRLNIALELIREPSILFVDEPTSGLSSSDSENIIDLLKELALKGKLVYVVIHQPSSDIYKKLDKLVLLDKGGYLIYEGNPIDALVYFKSNIDHVCADERECSLCGYVNPEQLFNIIEAKVIDEFGTLTKTRKTSPLEWHRIFLRKRSADKTEKVHLKIEQKQINKNRFNQFKVFFKRDLLSKISNKQYLIVNLIEAPILALILSFFVKFYKNESVKGYSYFENENIPQYIFIAVIVALFLGLTVSVEEIFKDRKILTREKFLNLSRFSYLLSKVGILIILSAFQTFLFVYIGNTILEIKGLYLEYWLVLFSISSLANVVGLNISSAFNSPKVIYVIVPLIIIPQLLFSGVIVKFDKLNPMFSKKNEVPWLGNSMAARWAYEALAVIQSTENKFQSEFFNLEQHKSNSSWKRDYWIPEMKNYSLKLTSGKSTKEEYLNSKEVVLNELNKENKLWSNFKCDGLILKVNQSDFLSDNNSILEEMNSFLDVLDKQYSKTKNDYAKLIESKILKIGSKEYTILLNKYENKKLFELVTNKRDLDKILNVNNYLVRMDNPIYMDPINTPFLRSHFYSPNKYVLGRKVSTFKANVIVLWGMSIIFFLTLYFNIPYKTISFFNSRSKKKQHKKRL